MTPAVVENFVAAHFLLAASDDRGDAEADRIRGDVARVLSQSMTAANMLAAHRAIGRATADDRTAAATPKPRGRQSAMRAACGL